VWPSAGSRGGRLRPGGSPKRDSARSSWRPRESACASIPAAQRYSTPRTREAIGHSLVLRCCPAFCTQADRTRGTSMDAIASNVPHNLRCGCVIWATVSTCLHAHERFKSVSWCIAVARHVELKRALAIGMPRALTITRASTGCVCRAFRIPTEWPQRPLRRRGALNPSGWPPLSTATRLGSRPSGSRNKWRGRGRRCFTPAVTMRVVPGIHRKARKNDRNHGDIA
jgi:hypothetical protein